MISRGRGHSRIVTLRPHGEKAGCRPAWNRGGFAALARCLLVACLAGSGAAWAGPDAPEEELAVSACPALHRLQAAQRRWADKFGAIAQACDVRDPVAAPASVAPTGALRAPADPAPVLVTIPLETAAPALDAAPTVPARSAPTAPRRVERAVALSPLIDHAARAYDIDPLLMHAMARVESAHRTDAVSHAGAVGLMQVLPATAARFGLSREALRHPQGNLEASARYLKWLQGRFRNDLKLIVAAYNAGEGAVERHGLRVPPYAETQAYVQRVLTEYEHLRATAERLRRGDGERLQGLM